QREPLAGIIRNRCIECSNEKPRPGETGALRKAGGRGGCLPLTKLTCPNRRQPCVTASTFWSFPTRRAPRATDRGAAQRVGSGCAQTTLSTCVQTATMATSNEIDANARTSTATARTITLLPTRTDRERSSLIVLCQPGRGSGQICH